MVSTERRMKARRQGRGGGERVQLQGGTWAWWLRALLGGKVAGAPQQIHCTGGAVRWGDVQQGAVQHEAVQWEGSCAMGSCATWGRAMGSCAMRNCALWSRAMGKRALGSRATGSSALGKVTCNAERCNRQGFFPQELRDVEPRCVERAVQRGWLRAAGSGLCSGQGAAWRGGSRAAGKGLCKKE